MMRIDELLLQIQSCQICEDLPLGPRPVLQISESAKILIVGQAPGSAVHASGIPFDDPSGVRLRRWLGMDEDTFYDASKVAIVPMGFCYPGRGKSGDLPPRKECAPAWREAVLQKLENIELTLLVGKYAMDYHLGNQKNLTQQIKDWESCLPYIPLPHPSPRNNIWLKKNGWFEHNVIPEIQKKVASILK